MHQTSMNRRGFLKQTAATTSATWLLTQTVSTRAAEGSTSLHVACNEYPWGTYYSRQGRNFRSDLDASLGDVAAAGFDGFEPLIDSSAFLEQLGPLLRKHGLQMRSLYVNSTLHDREQIPQSSKEVLALAALAQELCGTTIIVTNPSPLRWGGPEDKTDDQLKWQAEALDQLGEKLRARGQLLAYHNHDAELRQAAREFHHMLVGTDPKNVTLCLDSHWIFRGSGNSTVALFDVLQLYGPRISELHLRQSREGIWSETFGEGDIDYAALVRHLEQIQVRPHIVLEQAVEAGSPQTLSAVEAHQRGREFAARQFAPLAG